MSAGVIMPHPIAFVRAVGQLTVIGKYVFLLILSGLMRLEWYQEVLLPDVSHVKLGIEAAEIRGESPP